MKIRISTIVKILIELLVLMHLCYFLVLFGNTSMFADAFIPKTRMMLFIFMMAAAFAAGLFYFKNHSKKFLMIEMLLLLIICIRGYVGALNDGWAWDDALALLRPYTYTFLSVTILDLLLTGKWNFEKLLKFLSLAITGDTIARSIDSLYASATGSLLWKNLVNGGLGERNGIVRINPCSLFVIAVPMLFYLYRISRTRRERGLWLICLGINVAYSFVIWQARSSMLYTVIILILLILMSGRMDRKKVIRFLIVAVILLIVVNTPYVSNFFDSFSASNSEYGGSTTARLNASAQFLLQYSEHPVFGVGLLATEDRYAIGGGMLEDLGFLYSIVQLGIPMIVFYITIFVRGLYVARKTVRLDPDGANMVAALTLSFVMYGINIDTFYLFALSVPFYLAITEYVAWEARQEEVELVDNDDNEFPVN